MPKEGTVCLLQFLEAQPNQEFVMSHLDEQHGILCPSAWIWASHNDCVLFVSWRYEICINNVSLMRHRKHRPHKSRLPAVDIRQIEISWHAVWELWLVGKGMRKLLTKSQERRRTARHLHEWYQLFKQSTRYKYYAFISLERHTSLFGFFKKQVCEEGRVIFPWKHLLWCVIVYVCVFMPHASVWNCETSNLPLLQNVLHSWRQLPTANSIPGVFLRPDKLNLTVIRLISPFRSRYCLPGRAARQPYLCLQLPETKSFSSPVIFSLRPCTQRHSESQTSNARL